MKVESEPAPISRVEEVSTVPPETLVVGERLSNALARLGYSIGDVAPVDDRPGQIDGVHFEFEGRTIWLCTQPLEFADSESDDSWRNLIVEMPILGAQGIFRVWMCEGICECAPQVFHRYGPTNPPPEYRYVPVAPPDP